MSSDPNKAELSGDNASPSGGAQVAGAMRRKYAAPQLKQLGSVRDLTLGSPPGKAADGALAKRAAM